MQTALLLLARTVLAALAAIELCMLLRAILSLFADPESTLLSFCYAVTEPVILPFRVMLSRFESLDSIPLDIPFLVTYVVLALVGGLLPAVA
jgi:uncharacterized protein YggT (Ycf19 family)